jgi:hypothetical protein
MKKLITIFLMAGICSCGARKSQVTKTEKELEVQTEITGKSVAEKATDINTSVSQSMRVFETGQGYTEETETNFTALDPARPIIEVRGTDTLKVYNANKSVKTTRRAYAAQKETVAATDSNTVEKVREKRQNDVSVKQNIKASESGKEKQVDKKSALAWLPVLLLLLSVLFVLWAWLTRKKKQE